MVVELKVVWLNRLSLIRTPVGFLLQSLETPLMPPRVASSIRRMRISSLQDILGATEKNLNWVVKLRDLGDYSSSCEVGNVVDQAPFMPVHPMLLRDICGKDQKTLKAFRVLETLCRFVDKGFTRTAPSGSAARINQT